MRNLEEFLLLRQLYSGGQGWITCGLLICLFGVLVWRSDKIGSEAMFRLAWVFLVLSFLLPAVMQLGLGLVQALEIVTSSTSRGMLSLFTMLEMGCGPVLVGLSMLFAFLAVSPRQQAPHRAVPVRHPLE
jgi:hypothetical protein